jgi:hypothetical protein
MDKELLKSKYKGHEAIRWPGKGIHIDLDKIIEEYLSLPIDSNITDVELQRICATMNKLGYETNESCLGHEKHLPRIFFYCKDQELLRDISYIVKEYTPTNEPWVVTLFESRVSAPPFLNPDSKLCFILSPEDARGKFSDLSKRYNKSVEDLDVIGLGILLYFETYYEK